MPYPHAYLAGVAYIAAASGDQPRAHKALLELMEYSRHNYVSPVDFASYYATVGDRERAFQFLDKGLRQHSTWMITLEVNPGLDSCDQIHVL